MRVCFAVLLGFTLPVTAAAQSEDGQDQVLAEETVNTYPETQSAVQEQAQQVEQQTQHHAQEAHHDADRVLQDPKAESGTLVQTLDSFDPGYYVGGIVRGTVASGNMGMMLGLRGGLIVDHSILLGAAGLISVVGPQLNLPGTAFRNDRFLSIGYAGPEVGYSFNPHSLVHINVRTLLGIGGLGHNSDRDSDSYVGTDTIFVLEPSAELVLNVWEMMRAGIGVGYRIGYDVELEGLPVTDSGRVTVANGLNIDFTIEADFL